MSFSRFIHTINSKFASEKTAANVRAGASLASQAAQLRKRIEEKQKQQMNDIQKSNASDNVDDKSFIGKVQRYRDSFVQAGKSSFNKQVAINVDSPMAQNQIYNLAMRDSITESNRKNKLNAQVKSGKPISIFDYNNEKQANAHLCVDEKFASELSIHAKTIGRIKKIARKLETEQRMLSHNSIK